MKLSNNTSSFTLSMLPFFTAGLTDSLNPCAMTAIALFLVFLAVVGKTPQRILVLGTYFILGYSVTILGVIMGFLDLVIGALTIQLILRYLFLLLAFMAIGLGTVSMVDWWRYKKFQDTNRFIIKYPSILFSSEQEKADSRMGDKILFSSYKNIWEHPVFWAWVAGISTALLGSLWPPSYLLVNQYLGLFTPGEQLTSFLTFFVYTILMVLPMIGVFAGILYLIYNEKNLVKIKRAAAIVKIISGALFLGLGVGLIYFFI